MIVSPSVCDWIPAATLGAQSPAPVPGLEVHAAGVSR